MPNAMMKLAKFRIREFKSVSDSGWIECDDITTLIGTNEAGKTNILLSLWKLNPAKEGAIVPISDYPRKRFNEIRNMPDEDKPLFVEAHFLLSDELSTTLSELTLAPIEDVSVVSIARRFDGEYIVTFPEASDRRVIEKSVAVSVLTQAEADIEKLEEAGKTEEGIKTATLSAIQKASKIIADVEDVEADVVDRVKANLETVSTANALKTSTIVPRFSQVLEDVRSWQLELERVDPADVEGVAQLVLESMPSFVYYSQYGNLDSEIYLPQVIENLNRTDLTGVAAAKARTLRVLFDFVELDPQEIFSLGEDFQVVQPNGTRRKPTEEEIESAAAKKKEREVLLQSASATLTEKFRNWWKQGEYRFRFQADGHHFRIWVSDDRRPEEIELESRSTGLQWFLSFYLIFLVESQEAHAGTILLLDEAGLSLHALAQQDLTAFFESLAEKNQILNSTHSPFLVDSNHLDRVTAVFVDEDGTTTTSPDLRANKAEPARYKSVYAVHAALGLTVSDVILQGCIPVIVEGTSDQFFLNGVKNYLVREGLIKPPREVVFLPAYGVKGIPAIASIVAGKDEILPMVLVDSDEAGDALKNKLLDHLYQGHPDRLVSMKQIRDLEGCEVEDLMPPPLAADVITRELKGPDEDFDEVHDEGQPLVPQVKAYASKHGVELPDGWKVEVAKNVKRRLLDGREKDMPTSSTVEWWTTLFTKILANTE